MRSWLRGNWTGLSVGLSIAAAVLAGTWFWRAPPPAVTVIVPTPAPSPTVLIVVHVAGAVREPGVYRMAQGARVADAVDQAGGFSDDADTAGLNLAARVTDGQRLSIPRLGEARLTTPGRVNLNRASRPELEALPGIGPTTAQRIIEHRERNGPFRSLDELRDLRILPAQSVERLRDLAVTE